LIRGYKPVDVYKPNGEPLLLFRPNAIPLQLCERARPHLRRMGMTFSQHRGFHSQNHGNFAENGVCRKTNFAAKEVRKWVECIPFIRACDQVFRRELPDRYANQRAEAEKPDPEWLISDTVFTTLTVNTWDATHDARSPCHRDKYDLPEGFGVISTFTMGNYTGGNLIFPDHRLAIDLRTTDLLLADVHELHGNGPLEPLGGEPWERIATILYYYTDVSNCRDKKLNNKGN
jgi:hypothetical protein